MRDLAEPNSQDSTLVMPVFMASRIQFWALNQVVLSQSTDQMYPC